MIGFDSFGVVCFGVVLWCYLSWPQLLCVVWMLWRHALGLRPGVFSPVRVWRGFGDLLVCLGSYSNLIAMEELSHFYLESEGSSMMFVLFALVVVGGSFWFSWLYLFVLEHSLVFGDVAVVHVLLLLVSISSDAGTDCIRVLPLHGASPELSSLLLNLPCCGSCP
ncbi:hypothetical protein Ancab_017463 [Ancistrocladus abbreviatus]